MLRESRELFELFDTFDADRGAAAKVARRRNVAERG
jgi:hypothetical protein